MGELRSGGGSTGAVAFLLVFLGLSACGSSTPARDALSGKSAADVVRLALHNAASRGVMHFSIKTQAAGTQNVVGDATSQGGDVVVTNASSTVRILVTGGTGYIKTDGASLQSGLGLPSTV